MKVTVKIDFEVRECSPDVCEKFNKPQGTWELIDSDGIRCCFGRDEQHCMDLLFGIMEDAYLGSFIIE